MGRIAGVTPEETRDRLIDAAAEVFERKGFEGATVAEIARAAGVSTGAIYAHYATRAELLVDALRCHSDRAVAGMVPPGATPDAAALLTLLAEQLTVRDRPGSALLSEALLASRRDSELAAVLADALAEQSALTASVVAAGQADGTLRRDFCPDVAARFALMLGLGSMLADELDLPPVDQTEWNRFARRCVGAFTQEPPS